MSGLHEKLVNRETFSTRLYLEMKPGFVQMVTTVLRHNGHYCSSTRPYHIITVKLDGRQMCGEVLLVNTYIVGPYYFEEHLNAEMYLEFLVNHLYFLEDGSEEMDQHCDHQCYQNSRYKGTYKVQGRRVCTRVHTQFTELTSRVLTFKKSALCFR